MRSVPIMGLGMLLLAGLFAASPARSAGAGKPEIVIDAAASLREALEEVAPRCEKTAGVTIVLNLGASSDLARQIEAAGKADLFFSADEFQVDRLAKSGLVEEGTRRSILSNRLEVITPEDSSLALKSAKDLAAKSVRHLSLANPESVPAGEYAKAWLEKAGVWDSVKDRVVPGVDVRAALAMVSSGAAEAGIVYATDAAIDPRVRVLLAAPAEEAPPISYPLVVLKGRPSQEAARRVAACLSGEEALAIYAHRGFIVKNGTP
jgi:molybdate transport system substrate-binding protein